MAYGRKTYGRKTYGRKRYGRRTYGRKRYTGQKTMEMVAQRVINKNLEKKYIMDRTAGGIAITTTGTLGIFPYPALGTAVNERTGNEIRASSYQFKSNWVLGDETNFCRFIVFQWLDRSPTSPTLTDILEAQAGVANVNSLYNKTLGSSFKILYDKTFGLNDNGREVMVMHKLITRGFKRKVEFNAATTLSYNSVWWLAISDSAAVPNPAMSMDIRTNYTDA